MISRIKNLKRSHAQQIPRANVQNTVYQRKGLKKKDQNAIQPKSKGS